MGTQPPNNQSLCFYGGTEMTSQNNLRDRIAAAITRCPSVNPYVMARAVIDELELELTAHCDDCGYHEIRGSYDTRFEN